MNELLEVFKDSHLSKIHLFFEVYEFLRTNNDPYITPGKIATYFPGVSHNTVRKYIDAMIDAGVVIKLQRAYIDKHNRIKKTLAYGNIYCIDEEYMRNNSDVKEHARHKMYAELRKKQRSGEIKEIMCGVTKYFTKNNLKKSVQHTLDIDWIFTDKSDNIYYGIYLGSNDAKSKKNAEMLKHILSRRGSCSHKTTPDKNWFIGKLISH